MTVIMKSCSILTGDYQQYHHTQHDVHQDITEVWPMGRQPGQHCVWIGLLLRAATGQGEVEQVHGLNLPCTCAQHAIEYISVKYDS